MYDNKTFRSVTNTSNGEVTDETLFHYHQQGQIVWADYSGGSIVKGFLIATVQEDNGLDMRYQHVNTQGELMTGRCYSTPEHLPDGASDCMNAGNGPVTTARPANLLLTRFLSEPIKSCKPV